MKKKLMIIAIIVVLLGFFSYSYLYKEHRDISSEDSIAVSSVEKIFNEFKSNEAAGNKTYLDKVILIKGKITQIDTAQNVVTIDEKLFSSFQEKDFQKMELHSEVTVKGRFMGYDDLLEELKMDNCVLVK